MPATLHQNPASIRSPLVELERMPTMSTLPPEWVDKYEECLAMIKSIDDISICLIKLREENHDRTKQEA